MQLNGEASPRPIDDIGVEIVGFGRGTKVRHVPVMDLAQRAELLPRELPRLMAHLSPPVFVGSPTIKGTDALGREVHDRHRGRRPKDRGYASMREGVQR
jgi:hypothetical protein